MVEFLDEDATGRERYGIVIVIALLIALLGLGFSLGGGHLVAHLLAALPRRLS